MPLSCIYAGVFYPEPLDIVAVEGQFDVHARVITATARAAPSASQKQKNRAIHSQNGNESRDKRRIATGKRKQLSNLIPQVDKKKARPIAEPAQIAVRDVASQTFSTASVCAKPLSHAAMLDLQIDANLSDMQMRKIARFLRKETECSKIIEPWYEENLIEHHKIFEDLYDTKTLTQKIPLRPHPMVYCTDVGALIERVAAFDGREVRSIHHSVDSGKGKLLFSLTVEYETKSGEQKQSDEGRRRVIALAVIPNIQESNAVFREVYDLLQMPVDKYFHSFHADLKAVAFATGTDGGNSSYPCFACETRITVDRTLPQQLTSGKLRSCQSNRRHYKRLTASKGGDVANKHFNCSSNPLSMPPQSTPIISWCRMPQLHLHLHLNYYIHWVVKLHPATAMWYKHFNQTPSEFHGGDFQGPQLHRLSRRDSFVYLRELLVRTSAPPNVMLFFEAMAAFIDLEHKRFSRTLLDYKPELKKFKDACLRLPIRKVPVKMHIVIAHLDRAIRETGRALGVDSEQQFEAAHYDFQVVWERYWVRDENNHLYEQRTCMLRAHLNFNSSHVTRSTRA